MEVITIPEKITVEDCEKLPEGAVMLLARDALAMCRRWKLRKLAEEAEKQKQEAET